MIITPENYIRSRNPRPWSCGKHFHDSWEEAWRCRRFHQWHDRHGFFHGAHAHDAAGLAFASAALAYRCKTEPQFLSYALDALLSISSTT